MEHLPKPSRVAIVGNYVPRRCGIATFTTDLCEAIAREFLDANCFAVPVNDIEEGYSYPPRVRFEIAEQELDSYHRVAEFLNLSEVDVVSIQHEYGIFGGPAGNHVLELLAELRMPVVTTLHTVLKQPDDMQRSVLNEIARLSDRVVVMAELGAEFLRDIYSVPPDKIDVIPHGIPDVPFVDPSFFKDRFGVEGKHVILTFGLLSPNKGIENVIRALPAIVARHPEVIYIVTGATHPHVLRRHGEAYRNSLDNLATSLGVRSHVMFYNQFVDIEELMAFIGAADIYVTPYVSAAQISSGTLAYALGAGKAIISTPYWYAEELLDGGRGALVPFNDPDATAAKVNYLLENETERHAMRKRAYLFARKMIWPNVAAAYLESFRRAREERVNNPRPICAQPDGPACRAIEPPAVPNLQHVRHMTDDTGMLQHAIYSVPNYTEGYATDDNARALIFSVLMEQTTPDRERSLSLGSRYLAFLWHAYNPEAGRFRNFLSFDRHWKEEIGSEDAHGRALWALGTVLGRCPFHELRGPAARLFHWALPEASHLRSPRAVAFALLGLDEYMVKYRGDKAAQYTQRQLSAFLLHALRRHGSPEWPWFEDVLAYDNARLPQALLLASETLDSPEMRKAALKALQWLVKLQRSERDDFVPIGSNGFYHRGGTRARFDQQPIEAWSTLSACLAAHRLTRDHKWRDEADRAFRWFLGHNDLHVPLYDPETGGCHDGLQPDRINQNQGAESTLAFLLSDLELRLHDRRPSTASADRDAA